MSDKLKEEAPVIDLNGARARGLGEWPDPDRITVSDEPVTPFPLDALGEKMGVAARDIIQGTKCPPALAGASVLAAASFAVQGSYDVEFVRQSRRPLSLNILTIARSGERKSTADALALHGAYAFQEALFVEFREHLKEKAADESEDGDNSKWKPDPNIIVNTGTMHGLFKGFEDGYATQAVFNDEGGAFLGGYSFKAENRLHGLTALSKFWDGGPQTHKLRGVGKKSETTRLQNCRLTVHLLAQPAAIMPFISDPMARGQGLLARFLIHQPTSTMGTRIMSADEWCASGMTDALDDFSECIRSRLGSSLSWQTGKKEDRPVLALSPGAREALRQFSNEMERKLAPDGEHESYADLVNKAAEQAVRIAGGLAVLQNSSLVSENLMKDGIRVARYFIAETIRVARAAPHEQTIDDALTIACWLHHHNGSVQKAVYSKTGPKRLRKVADRLAAFDLLKAANWMKETENGRVVLNPKCIAFGLIDPTGANRANGAKLE